MHLYMHRTAGMLVRVLRAEPYVHKCTFCYSLVVKMQMQPTDVALKHIRESSFVLFFFILTNRSLGRCRVTVML